MHDIEFSHNPGRISKSVRPNRQQAEPSGDKSRLVGVGGT